MRLDAIIPIAAQLASHGSFAFPYPSAENIIKSGGCASDEQGEREANLFRRPCVAQPLLQRQSRQRRAAKHLSERSTFQSGGKIATL